MRMGVFSSCYLLLLMCLFTATAILTSGKKTKPNILFILTDDQDGLLNGYTDKGIAHMEQLNTRVRDSGVLFTNYYLAYPLCSPSRSTILSGRFTHNTGFYTNSDLNSSKWHPRQEAHTVNTWLQKAGYHTMLCGKYMNGYHGSKGKWAHYVPPGWGDWYGFQTVAFMGTQVNVNGKSTKYPEDNYQTDIIANISLNWLRNSWNQSQPFFMFLTPHAPHKPYTPAPRHLGTLANLTMSLDPSFNMSEDLQKLLPGVLAKLPEVKVDAMNKIFQKRAESLLAIDEMIGHLLDELRELGVEKNTYVFFTCDNGYHLGQQRLPPGKREIFQHDINVPLIISGPGIGKKSTIMDIAGNYDLASTWAELAGVTPPADAPVMDGRSLVPLFSKKQWSREYTLQEGYQSCEMGRGEGKACSHKDLMFAEVPPPNVMDFATSPDYTGLHKPGKWLYAEYKDGGRIFFDTTVDPWQTNNIWAKLPKENQTEMAAMLAAVVMCNGTACP